MKSHTSYCSAHTKLIKSLYKTCESYIKVNFYENCIPSTNKTRKSAPSLRDYYRLKTIVILRVIWTRRRHERRNLYVFDSRRRRVLKISECPECRRVHFALRGFYCSAEPHSLKLADISAATLRDFGLFFCSRMAVNTRLVKLPEQL